MSVYVYHKFVNFLGKSANRVSFPVRSSFYFKISLDIYSNKIGTKVHFLPKQMGNDEGALRLLSPLQFSILATICGEDNKINAVPSTSY